MSFLKKAGIEKPSGTELLKLGALSVLTGVFGGIVSAAFLFLLSWVTGTRESAPWLLLLLPVGGVATVLLFRFSKLSDHGGVNEIIHNIEVGAPVRALVAPLIFLCTGITHLLGGSAGKEGAALQLGGAGAAFLAKPFKLKSETYSAVILCGMSAVFAGVFGTPLTAALFVFEFKATGKKFFLSALPCILSAYIASFVAPMLYASHEAFHLAPFSYDLATVAKVILLSACACGAGFLWCFSLRMGKSLMKKWLKNPMVRILVGAVAVIGLTILVGDMRYNGSGMEMAVKATEGEAAWFDFAMKILFTVITAAAGFKGGEIVPTFCIGATFGCVMGTLLGMPPSLAAVLGLVVLFAYSSNSLVSAIFLGLELFGFAVLPYVILSTVVAILLSGEKGLFHGRFFRSPLISFMKKTKAE